MIDIIAIREAAGRSRQEIADELGFSERSGRVSVAQMEGREDWLVSRLAAYIHASGGTAELIVKVNGRELRFRVA